MPAKNKGINAERELIHLFFAAGWVASRVAGSGSIRYPAPDVIAGNGLRRIVIEAKSSKTSQSVYLTRKEVEELRLYAAQLSAEPWIAIRFNHAKWQFICLGDLDETPTQFVADVKKLSLRAVSFEELTCAATP